MPVVDRRFGERRGHQRHGRDGPDRAAGNVDDVREVSRAGQWKVFESDQADRPVSASNCLRSRLTT